MYIQYCENQKIGNWKNVSIIEFLPFKKLYPEEKADNYRYGVKEKKIKLPSKEKIKVGAFFSTKDNALNYFVELDGENYLSTSAFKRNLEAYDPAVNMRLPSKNWLAVSFSNVYDDEIY